MAEFAAFVIWAITGALFVCIGIYSFFAKKPLGFWANAKLFELEDIRGYNRAVGKLWMVFGIVFITLGLPLLSGQNSPLVLFSVLGVMLEAVAAMVVYTLMIDKRYRKK